MTKELVSKQDKQGVDLVGQFKEAQCKKRRLGTGRGKDAFLLQITLPYGTNWQKILYLGVLKCFTG